MTSRRLRHLGIALFVVLSLLVSQWAVAGYACPGRDVPARMAAMMAAGVPCDGMDAASPALCDGHGTASPQSFEAFKVPTPTLPMIVQVLELARVLGAGAAVAAPVTGAVEARPPPEPVFLATLRLRV